MSTKACTVIEPAHCAAIASVCSQSRNKSSQSRGRRKNWRSRARVFRKGAKTDGRRPISGSFHACSAANGCASKKKSHLLLERADAISRDSAIRQARSGVTRIRVDSGSNPGRSGRTKPRVVAPESASKTTIYPIGCVCGAVDTYLLLDRLDFRQKVWDSKRFDVFIQPRAALISARVERRPWTSSCERRQGRLAARERVSVALMVSRRSDCSRSPGLESGTRHGSIAPRREHSSMSLWAGSRSGTQSGHATCLFPFSKDSRRHLAGRNEETMR